MPGPLRSLADRQAPAKGASSVSRGLSSAEARRLTSEVALANDDDLFAKHGVGVASEDDLGIPDYRQMMRQDAQVQAAVKLKILARLSSGWHIEAASEDPADVERADYVKAQFEEMDGTISGFLRRAMLASAYGLTVHEKVLRLVERGPWAGKIGLKALKWRRPETFKMVPDKFGNLTRIEQKQGQEYVSMPDPKLRFVVWCHEHEGDWSGRSELRAVYRWSKKKDLVDKIWGVFLDRYANPTPIGHYKRTAKKLEQLDVLGFLTRLSKKGAAVVPDDWDVKLLETARTGADFHEAIKYSDRMIARGVLLPTLIMDEGESGAYALGAKHADNFTWVLDALGEDISGEIMGDQIIAPLVDLNFADTYAYPRFVWDAWSQDDVDKLVLAFATMIDKGVLDPSEPFIRERLGWQEAAEIDPDIIAERAAKKAAATAAAAPAGDRPGSGTAGDGAAGAAAHFASAPTRSPHTRKFDRAATVAALDAIEGEAVAAMASATAEMHGSLLKSLAKSKIVEERRWGDVDALQLRGGADFRRAAERMLGLTLHTGFETALREVNSGLEAVGGKPIKLDLAGNGKINFTAHRAAEFTYRDTLDDVVAAFARKIPIQRDLLVQYTREAFTISGVHRDKLLTEAQGLIRRAIRRGASSVEVRAELGDLFRPYLEVPGAVDPALADPWRLDTIARSNMAEAFNTGRWNLFMHPEVRDFIQAFEYSAIMDENTTAFCESWNGKVLLRDDVHWSMINPPNHHKCRSVLIPIVSGEKFTVTDSLPAELPATGFRV